MVGVEVGVSVADGGVLVGNSGNSIAKIVDVGVLIDKFHDRSVRHCD